MKRATTVGSLLSLAIVSVAWAWTSDPSTNTALSLFPADQYNLQTIPDNAGGAILVWEQRLAGQSSDIYAQRIDATGATVWEDDVPVCLAAFDQQAPRIVPDGAGGVVITWQDDRADGLTHFDIYAQRLNANGQALWPLNGVPVCTAANTQEDPVLTPEGTGGAILAWTDHRTDRDGDVFAQRLDGSGAPQWAHDGMPVAVLLHPQAAADIVGDGAGQSVVVWTDLRNFPAQDDLFAQRLNADGSPHWPLNGIGVCVAPGLQFGPHAIADGQGGMIVTWTDARAAQSRIFAQKVSPMGSLQWPSAGVPLTGAMPGDQFMSAPVADHTGGAVVAWVDERSGNRDIYAQRINASGITTWAVNGVPVCTAAGDQELPLIVDDLNGGAVLSWNDGRNGPPAYLANDLFAQRLMPNGNVLWASNGITVSSALNGQLSPRIVPTTGGVILAWEDFRNTGTGFQADLFGQRVRLDGTLGN